jgi:hypothetical protein
MRQMKTVPITETEIINKTTSPKPIHSADCDENYTKIISYFASQISKPLRVQPHVQRRRTACHL